MRLLCEVCNLSFGDQEREVFERNVRTHLKLHARAAEHLGAFMVTPSKILLRRPDDPIGENFLLRGKTKFLLPVDFNENENRPDIVHPRGPRCDEVRPPDEP